MPECEQGVGAGGPEGGSSGVHRVSDSAFVRDGAAADGIGVADIQDLYGHTDPETTMIYAPPRLQKHVDAIARLERADRSPAPADRPIRLATTPANLQDGTVSY